MTPDGYATPPRAGPLAVPGGVPRGVPRGVLRGVPRAAVLTVGIGAVIAAVAPYDRVFWALTFDSPALQAGLLLVLGLAGVICAQRIGLTIPAHDLTHRFATPLLIGAMVAGALALLDAMVPATVLSVGYARFIGGTPLAARLLYFMTRAFNENILYRLCLTSVLAWGLGHLVAPNASRRNACRTPRPVVFFVAAVLAQCINIWCNVALRGGPFTPWQAAYDGVRYVAPGVLWAYLYGKHGFVSAEIASVGCHLFFQPLLGLVF